MKLRALIEEVVKSREFDPAQVSRDINRYKVEFLYLCGEDSVAASAYRRLRLTIDRGENPRDVYFKLPRADLLRHFYGQTDAPFFLPQPSRERHLPRWFREEIRAYLKAPSFHSQGDLSYWLVARLLQDGTFMDALQLVRKRWHVGGEPREWYGRMNKEQEERCEYTRSLGIELHFDGGDYLKASPTDHWNWPGWKPNCTLLISDIDGHGCGFGFSDPGGVRFLECRDFRDTGTYQDSLKVIGVGFPIDDYEQDLGVLAWLAGGDSQSREWRIWIEVLLWSFQHPPSFVGNEHGFEHWLGLGRNMTFAQVCYVQGSDYAWRPSGKVRFLPRLSEVTTKTDTPSIRLLSRWIRLGDYSESLQPQLVHAIVREWGDYQEPPDRANLRRAVEALSRPQSDDEAWEKVDQLAESDDLADLGKLDTTYVNAARKRRSRQSSRRATPHQRPFQKGRP